MMWRGREGGERERDYEGKRGGREREMMWRGRKGGERE